MGLCRRRHVAHGFRPDRVAPWSDHRAAALLDETCEMDVAVAAAALDSVGRGFGAWS
jgi:hypothetical protein